MLLIIDNFSVLGGNKSQLQEKTIGGRKREVLRSSLQPPTWHQQWSGARSFKPS